MRVPALGALLLAALAPGSGLPLAQEPAPRVFTFADPSAPVAVIARVAYAEIEVVGSDRRDVLVSEVAIPGEVSPEAAAMIRATTYLLPQVHGNSLRIEAADNDQMLRLRLEVPRTLTLELWGSNGGRITVRDVQGALAIENSNAGVTLTGVSGSALVFASNGSIEGEFLGVTAGAPMSFATSNGIIDLTFPPDLRADLLMETDNAGFVSEFDIELEGAGAVPLPPGRRRLAGRVNGGGPLLRLQTENAQITLRRGLSGR